MSTKFGFRLSNVTPTWFVELSFTQRIFNTKFFGKVFRQSLVRISLIKQNFSAIFLLIFLRKNRSEAFCVSSENMLHTTGKGFARCGTTNDELRAWKKSSTCENLPGAAFNPASCETHVVRRAFFSYNFSFFLFR